MECECCGQTIKQPRFKKPTFEQVGEYCQERQNNIDAEQFIDFYESKGWMIGKNKMKDWKAAVRTWERRANEKNQQHSGKLSVVEQREIDNWINGSDLNNGNVIEGELGD